MNTFLQSLAERELAVFDVEDLDEFVQGLYILLRIAVRQECDTFALNKTQITWSKSGKVMGSNPVMLVTESVYQIMRESLLKIVERDSVVRQHLRLIQSNEDQLIYSVVYDQN